MESNNNLGFGKTFLSFLDIALTKTEMSRYYNFHDLGLYFVVNCYLSRGWTKAIHCNSVVPYLPLLLS